ncbi:holo-ACP synthase [Exiguobacterium sp. s193]|uniref:holo-ACP synthase n=1 Tax=Exiguobacterium sp. s193 TaxID=2751207 RepID=UPI001BE6DAF8|nr:holo-ACP synthase [Exiguobacterium sp. s193]
MIYGIGLDLIELDRVRLTLERQPRMLKRVLTEREQARYETLKGTRQLEYIAGRFAAKEAFVKAFGTGIGREVSWLDLEVLNETSGRPVMTGPFEGVIHVSITHSDHYAAAQVLLEKRDADVPTDLDRN